MKKLMDLSDDEHKLRSLHVSIARFAAQRDKAKVTKSSVEIDLKNLNSMIVGMTEDMEALKEKKVELIEVEEDAKTQEGSVPPEA